MLVIGLLILDTARRHIRASLVAQMKKKLPAVQKTWVGSLGWEDLLEKEMAVHSSTISWKIPWIDYFFI